MKSVKGLLTVLVGLMLATVFAGDINVSAPAKGTLADPTLVKASTTISFALKQMGRSEAQIDIRVVRTSDSFVLLDARDVVRVKPDTTNDDGNGTYNLTFTEGTPEVTYRVEVRARPVQAGATTYNTDQNLFVKPDLTKPKILQFNPVGGSFVKGIVPIRIQVDEPNLKDWRIQINNQDIPNNQGTTLNANREFVVNFDTTGIRFDSTQNANVRIRDLADNEETLTIALNLDRVAPVVTIAAPQNNSRYSAGTTINVVVDVRDQTTSSVNANGIDIIVRDSAGRFITRVARQSITNVDNNTIRWTGRIRFRASLPRNLKIEAVAVDRAGNRGNPQVVNVSFQ